MKKVVLILPTYNERDNIVTLIPAIEDVSQKLKNYKIQILVVDDASPDGTGQLVEKLTKKFKNLQLITKKKEGLGAAYVFAMKYALKNLHPDILIQMDADWSHNPHLLPEFFRKLENGADFVIGSRYIRGGSIPGNWGLHRKIYSIIGNNVVRFGLGMRTPHDWTSGYRLMRSDIFNHISHGLDKYSGYTFQVAFLHRVRLSGYTVAEVPLQFVDRVYGKSKIAPADYIKNVLIYIIHKSTFIKYLIIGVLGFGIQSIISKILISVKFFPGVAVTVGAFCAIVSNFWGNNLWTFSHMQIKGAKALFSKFSHFLATSIGAVIIQGVAVSVGVLFLGKESWFLVMIFSIIFLVIPYNFFVYNKYIWKPT